MGWCMRNNSVRDTSLNTHIPVLQARGVNVLFGASKPGVKKDNLRDMSDEVMKLFGIREWRRSMKHQATSKEKGNPYVGCYQ